MENIYYDSAKPGSYGGVSPHTVKKSGFIEPLTEWLDINHTRSGRQGHCVCGLGYFVAGCALNDCAQ
jgi:hypothetical protein